MRIHSRFKDYYDFVAHAYGGGDPKVIYNRERITDPYMENGQIMYERTVEVPESMVMYIPRFTQHGRTRTEHKGLVLCGRWYILLQISQIGLDKEFPYHETVTSPWHVLNGHSTKDYTPGIQKPQFIELCRHLKAPVFTITGQGYNNHEVEGRVPNLGELGFARIMPPEQCYQEIAMFMSNTILVNPDESPESKPPLTNVEKAVAHGFDKKQSFRHRK